MNRRPPADHTFGYYVHHHGAGHAQRFLALAEVLPGLTGLGSGPIPTDWPRERWVGLPSDLPPAGHAANDPTASGALHWAPIDLPGMQERTARIAGWVEEHRPAAMVVDVSVEVTVLARLLSVPTVVVVQHGRRDDRAHELAFRCASAVAALWPAGAAPAPAAAGRVEHVGLISRFDDRIVERPHATASASSLERRRCLLLLGRGGHQLADDAVGAAMQATSAGWQWEIVGGFPELGGREVDGDALWHALQRADVVIASASNNCVAEVAAARRPLIVLPQLRPFDEQHAHARALERLGLAIVADPWPRPGEWPRLLDHAARSGGRWERFHDGLGATRLADLVREVVAA